MPTAEKDLIASILLLQDVEKRLFGNLEAAVANKAPAAEQESIMTEMNEAAVSRTALYQSLLSLYENQQALVADTRQDLVDQKTVVKIFEDQMNNAKHNFNAMREESANKLRMVEINTYYGKKYQAYGSILKVIVVACVPLLLLAILRHWSVIPSGVSTFLGIVVLIVAAYLVVRRTIDMLSRSNMSFDEYNWQFDPADTKSLTRDPGAYDIRSATSGWMRSLGDKLGLGCVGQECCSDGMTYDGVTHKCVEGASAADTAGRVASHASSTVVVPVASHSAATTRVPIKLSVTESVQSPN